MSLSLSLKVTGRRMRTVINIYIGNLALADCIIAVFCIPFQFQAALLQKWNLPFFMCKLCPFVQVSEEIGCHARGGKINGRRSQLIYETLDTRCQVITNPYLVSFLFDGVLFPQL